MPLGLGRRPKRAIFALLPNPDGFAAIHGGRVDRTTLHPQDVERASVSSP